MRLSLSFLLVLVAAGCASIADAAIAEWRKRFAAKEEK